MQTPQSIGSEANGNRTTIWLSWLGAGLFLLLIIWASFGKLDVVSTAIGQVVPASKVKQVQHLEGGIVREILVDEGEVVKRGQRLIILEPTRSKADVDELSLRIAAIEIDIARLDAESEQSDAIQFPDRLSSRYPDLIEKSRAFFQVRKERLKADLTVQHNMIEQRRQNIREVKARIKKSRSLYGFISEQVKISEDLLSKSLSNRMQHLELLRQVADIEGNIAISEASFERVQSTIQEAEAKLISIHSSFIEDVRAERTKLFRNLQELSERLIRLQDSLSRTILRAPVDGIVKTLNVTTEGGVIKPGSTVLELVPSDDKLVVEARLAIRDIGFVQVGNETQLQLASSDAQLFNKLIGQVTHISPDTLVNEKGVAFYKIRIETDQAYFDNGSQRFKLYPGMNIQSNILTGQRTVMEYILSPILGSADSALQER